MSGPRRPRPVIAEGTPSHRLIRGVLRMNAGPLHISRVELHRVRDWTATLVDTGDGVSGRADGDTTFHILWQAKEDDAWIAVDGERFPIAPGDTMSVPGGTLIEQAGGMLLVEIEASNASLGRILPPSHGVESFEGYNRRTDYPTPQAFALQRWKITQPLAMPASPEPYTIIDLAAPLALTWAGGTDLIGRGECRVIEPGVGPVTLLPDGLGYALVIRQRAGTELPDHPEQRDR